MGDLLRVQNLTVSFPGSRNGSDVLAGVDLEVGPGEATALVGPSGCGKSLLTRAVLGLLPPGAAWKGEIYWRGERLRDPHGRRWRDVRGRGMALVLQEPQTSLNPVMRVGDQIAETVRFHGRVSRRESRDRAVSLLAEMLVPDPAAKASCFPHQLSGGMRQRVLLACAMASDPALLIADEPTTALDVTVQREILALIKRIGRDRAMALVFITHDAELVPLVANRRVEMSAGRIVSVVDLNSSEISGPDDKTGIRPTHADVEQGVILGRTPPVLLARNLVADYARSSGGKDSLRDAARAPVNGVDVDLIPGRSLGLAGESGCGKTTLARVLSRHMVPRSGTITFEGEDFLSSRGKRLRQSRRRCQMLFQDPAGSLNPRQTIGRALGEAAPGGDPTVVEDLLREVGLPGDLAHRFPHELSGGQRQRVAIARCLATDPRVLIADEPTSALDSASRDRILDLLSRTMNSRGLALMLIAHDFTVLHRICHRVSVMYRGMIVESYRVCDRHRIAHPYTLALMAATPANLNRDQAWWVEAGTGPGKPNTLIDTGCPLAGNCPLQKSHCVNELPPLTEVSPGHFLRCPETQVDGPSQFIDT